MILSGQVSSPAEGGTTESVTVTVPNGYFNFYVYEDAEGNGHSEGSQGKTIEIRTNSFFFYKINSNYMWAPMTSSVYEVIYNGYTSNIMAIKITENLSLGDLFTID